MMKKLFYGSVVFSMVMSAVGCTQQAANPGQASLDDFCRQFPMSASCPDGKNAIAKQDAFCAEFPLSVTCPDGRAAIQNKTHFAPSSQCPQVAQRAKQRSRKRQNGVLIFQLPLFAVKYQPCNLCLNQTD